MNTQEKTYIPNIHYSPRISLKWGSYTKYYFWSNILFFFLVDITLCQVKSAFFFVIISSWIRGLYCVFDIEVLPVRRFRILRPLVHNQITIIYFWYYSHSPFYYFFIWSNRWYYVFRIFYIHIGYCITSQMGEVHLFYLFLTTE